MKNRTKPGGAFRLYRHYVSLNFRSSMQYKSSFFMTLLGQTLVTFSTFLGIVFMFQRFPQVAGFTLEDVLLCCGIVQLQFAAAEMWARGFDYFSQMIRNAEFDRVLLRPRSDVLQVLGSRFDYTRLGRFIQGLAMMIYGIIKAQVSWNFLRVLTLFNMIVGGIVLFSGLFMARAAVCFFTIEGIEFMNIFTDGAREHGKYPLSIYGDRFLRFATFLIPYALIQYYPLLYLLGKRTELFFVFVPLFAVLFLIPVYALWRFGVRHYKSAGS